MPVSFASALRRTLALVLFCPRGGSRSCCTSPLATARAQAGNAAVFRYAEPGELTINVQAWGNVRLPGLYQIPVGSRLSTFVTLTGGPQFVQDRRVQDTRTITLRLFRRGPVEQPTLLLEREWINEATVLDQDPVLQEGDMVSIDNVVQQGTTRREDTAFYASFASIGISVLSILINLLSR